MDSKKPAEKPVQQDEPDSVTRFLWWLATVDPTVLKECGPEKERYRIIGVSVLVTWLFATLAWGYFFSTITNDDMVIYPLALFFGFAILAIDRNLIAAMGKSTQRNGNGFLPVVFRLALAVTIGLFLSQPIILMLFKKDINTQIELNKEKKLQTYRQKLIDLNAPLVARYQTEVATLQKQLKEADDQVKYYKDSYIKETDGTGGSGKIGEASVARVKRSAYQKSEETLGQLTQLGMHKATLAAEKERALQEHYATSSLEADKASVDQFFATSRQQKERMGKEVIEQSGSGSFNQLWQQFRSKVFSKKEV